VQQSLTSIVEDGHRAGEVIDRIRALMKKAPPQKDRLEINGVIVEIIELTRGEAMKYGISVLTELADHLPVVEADRVQLQQVLLNLIVNALDAMGAPNEGPGQLLISTGKVETSGVLVAVEDSGPGLEAAMLERVFESFYTTKPTGLGMGSQSAVRHRGAWRAPLGEHEPAAWGHLSIYASWRCKNSIVIGNGGGP